MQIWTDEYPLQSFSQQSLHYFPEGALFFDIETTGLSAKYHAVYCVGCCWRNGQSLGVRQFFAENPLEEPAVLSEFLAFSQKFRSLISFNGMRFDVPFLETRCSRHQLRSALPQTKHLDIYKECRRIRHLLSLPSCKQKAMERFLGIQRDDVYDGGQLIAVYEDYVRSPSAEAQRLLQLHNYEDLIGMPHLLSMLSYVRLLEDACAITEVTCHSYQDVSGASRSELLIDAGLPAEIPVPLRLRSPQCYMVLEKDRMKCSVPLVDGSMKHFLKDYRNYDFLPEEQMIVHKSLSAYVAAARKEPATPQNCYLTQNGQFFPIPQGLALTEDIKRFSIEKNDAQQYLQYGEQEWDSRFWGEYLRQALHDLNRKH